MKNQINEKIAKQIITIEIVSDYICPWCYIGKQRLDQALDRLKDKYDFKLTLVPFELNKEMPQEGQNRRAYRSKKFGSWEKSQAMDEDVTIAGKNVGLDFNYDKVEMTPNTFKAHLLTNYAQEVNEHITVSNALFKAYFTNGEDIGNEDVLLKVAEEAGLDTVKAKEILHSLKSINEVRNTEVSYTTLGVNSVPLYIIGSQAISGAQSEESFVQFITQNAAND
jgi:predicted DsbA family dithiol-disulfide isomerase